MLDPVTPSRGPDSPVRRVAAAGTDNLPDLLLVERARAGEEQAVAALIDISGVDVSTEGLNRIAHLIEEARKDGK